jgi:hypothetical protein
MKKFMLLLCLYWMAAAGQVIHSPQIKGMRIHGTAGAEFPVALLDSHPITIAFDADTRSPEDYKIIVYHCDKNWQKTESMFVNDPSRNFTTYQLPYQEAPPFVTQYHWTYTVSLPGFAGLGKFLCSGNYIFELWNDARTELLADGKFFVAEQLSDSLLTMYNRYLPSQISPWNQAQKAVLRYRIPDVQQQASSMIYPSWLKIVDVYRNRELDVAHRIDADNNQANTFIDGWGTNTLAFQVDDIQSGNEYRRMDISNADVYPPNIICRLQSGADISRWMMQGASDQNGSASLVDGSQYADYVQYQFEIARPDGADNENIIVVGDFNNWHVDPAWQLKYDPETRHYLLRAWLRRGAYDYQYVLNGNDWMTLEGNDWRTVSVYTALLYYHDTQYGGYDRILLCAQTKSSGSTEAASR